MAGSVALLDDKAYFGHYGNEFLRVDLDSGEVDWRYPSKREGFCSSPALNDTYAVFGGRDKNLHCVLRKDRPRRDHEEHEDDEHLPDVIPIME